MVTKIIKKRQEVVRSIRKYRREFGQAKKALRKEETYYDAYNHAYEAHWGVLDAAESSIMGLKEITRLGEKEVVPAGWINRRRHERVKRLQRKIGSV